ncbi:MAG: alpha/beta hydrolase [bacterium]|nr:alpha/beta hydrolase [bacterium]
MNKAMIRDDEVFVLPNGRQLGYAVYGDPQGKPVLFFHGIPGSRLQRNPDLSILNDLGVCIYALDRPGTGLSSYYKNRMLLDWPNDVRAFCDGLGIEKFSLFGISSGGPYALATAYKMQERVTHVSLVSALAPLHEGELFDLIDPKMKRLFSFAKRMPELMKGVLNVAFLFLKNKFDRAFEALVADLPESDKNLLHQPLIAEMFKRDVAEAFRQGSKGVVSDMKILSEPWGFSLEEIKLPVHIWHGTADTIVPVQLANFMIERLPNVQPHLIEGAGHFMAVQYTKEIFLQ